MFIHTVALIFVAFSGILADDLTIHLPDGVIRGHRFSSVWGGTFRAFQEIPYAAPPVGKDRFKPPRNPDPWKGVLNTTENTKQCFQLAEMVEPYEQSEDCLYLNVYTPQESGSNTLLPVVVWIHGGGLGNGNGNFLFNNPVGFMKEQLLVVTMNYRLGPIGFLTTMDGTISGNLGLKDQRFAIEWVKRNIKLFGGDPNKIIIAGVGFGANSVGYQLVGTNATGLFAGAVQESGSPLITGAFTVNARTYAFELGKNLDPKFDSQNSNELLDLLNKHSGAEIIAAAQKVKSLEGIAGGYIPRMMWLPVIESKLKDSSALITALPFISFLTGQFDRVPIIAGFNSEESLFFKNDSNPVNAEIAKVFDEQPDVILDGTKLNIPAENLTAATKEMTKIYTNTSFAKDTGAFVRYSTDSGVTFGLMKQAKVTSKYVNSYVYQFSYVGELGTEFAPFGRFGIKGCGRVGHLEELAYTWNINSTKISSQDLQTSARLLQLYKNFAYKQNPTYEHQDILDNISWPVVAANSDSYEFLDIGKDLKVMNNPRTFKQQNEVLKKYIVGPF